MVRPYICEVKTRAILSLVSSSSSPQEFIRVSCMEFKVIAIFVIHFCRKITCTKWFYLFWYRHLRMLRAVTLGDDSSPICWSFHFPASAPFTIFIVARCYSVEIYHFYFRNFVCYQYIFWLALYVVLILSYFRPWWRIWYFYRRAFEVRWIQHDGVGQKIRWLLVSAYQRWTPMHH